MDLTLFKYGPINAFYVRKTGPIDDHRRIGVTFLCSWRGSMWFFFLFPSLQEFIKSTRFPYVEAIKRAISRDDGSVENTGILFSVAHRDLTEAHGSVMEEDKSQERTLGGGKLVICSLDLTSIFSTSETPYFFKNCLIYSKSELNIGCRFFQSQVTSQQVKLCC